ncbi:Aste57867_11509 [Aphanomyces stellatus]|uniref:Aste57867_11509 protein n=1 Tax=Aphanomyces stellatus TaxID=120398 RepID=A0A485KUC0_9STRA|nr:hypothetical protein As57867_011466 [Aphanomyces stellatus]VFT88370.1 Aste57867_11509 [Aphanomyces stellatus]
MNAAIAAMVRTMANVDVDWDFHSEKDGVRAYAKADGPLTAVLGVGSLAFPANMVLDFLLASHRKAEYDPMCADARAVKTYDTHTLLDYYQSKPVLIVSGRDFVNLVHWRVLTDGSIVVVAKATKDPSCPPKDWTVRGEIHVAGWRIVPTSTSKCDVAFMVKMDLKGSIPTFVQNKIVVDQAYVILAVREVLTNSPFMPYAPVTNKGPVVAASAAPVAPLDRNSSVAASPPASPHKQVAPPSFLGDKSSSWHDVHGKPLPVHTVDLSIWTLAQYFALFLAALYLPPWINSEATFQLAHEALVWAAIGYIAIQVYLGPAHMSARRQVLIASWKASDSGTMYGSLLVDVTDTLAYIDEVRATTGEKVTITHVVLRAVAHALKRTPSMNGHIVLGKFYPSATVDVSCLVDVDGGKDMQAVTLPSADAAPIATITKQLTAGAQRIRSSHHAGVSNQLALLVPSVLLRPTLLLLGWLSQAFGASIPWLGLKPHMYGQAIVANVGRMGLDEGYAPMAPYTNTPMMVVVGAVTKKPVVVDGQVVVRPMLRLNATIDHRYADASEVARLAKCLREFVETPRVLDATTV